MEICGPFEETPHLLPVTAGLVPAIHVLGEEREGRSCPGQARDDGGESQTVERVQPPRSGGISTWSRRQARRSISSQARNCRSLLRQIRTSLRRLLSQVVEIADALKPGLALMKAASSSSGAISFGFASSRNSSGIFTVARALRMVSK